MALLTAQSSSEPPVSLHHLLRYFPFVCVTSAVSTDKIVHLKEPPQHGPSSALCRVTENPINSFPGAAFAIRAVIAVVRSN